jgi:hypothetical protein
MARKTAAGAFRRGVVANSLQKVARQTSWRRPASNISHGPQGSFVTLVLSSPPTQYGDYMSVCCHDCGSLNVRKATLRISDAVSLLTFRYPIRCQTCRKRWYISLFEARRLPRSPGRRSIVKKA